MKSISSAAAGRPPDRTNLIVREIRARIVAGDFAPGSQLPTRVEIENLYTAGAATVQRALEQLRQEGFIEVNGWRGKGTFVVEQPPHLNNFALVFTSTGDGERDVPLFWRALDAEAPALGAEFGCRIHAYHNVNQHGDSEDFRRLRRDVETHRLAGIIFASTPFLVDDSSVLYETGIERVAIMNPVATRFNCHCVTTSRNSFWMRAMNYLAHRGRRRVAFICAPRTSEDFGTTLSSLMEKAGLSTEPEWMLELSRLEPECAEGISRLLFSKFMTEKPDALIISDDHFVEHATKGLAAAAVNVPEDLEIVAHCNFPWPAPATVPVTYLGFDARQVLRECIINLRSKASPYETTEIPALFQNEIPNSRYSVEN